MLKEEEELRLMMPSRDELYGLTPEKQMLQYRRALQGVVNALGPDLCDCDECRDSCRGLVAEAGEALRIAKEALDGYSGRL